MSATSGIFGIGKGDAQVFGGNPALGMLQQAYQQDQARRVKDDAAFQTELAKVNFDGARQADLDPLLKSYEGVKDKYALLRATTTPLERNRLMNDINTEKQQLLSAVNLSKQTNAAEAKYAQLRLDRNNDLKDDFGKSYTGLIGTSIFDPAYKTKAEYFNDPFHPQYDTDKLAKEVEGMAIKKTEGKPYTRNQGGWQQLVRNDATKLDEAAATTFITQKAIQDPSLRRSIMYSYGKNGETPEQATQAFVNALLPGLRAKNTTVEKVLGSQAPEREKTPSWLEAWNLRNFGTPNAPKETDGRDTFIQQIEDGDKLSTEGLVSSVSRVGGKVVPNKKGLEIRIPTTKTVNVYEVDQKGVPTNEIKGTKKISVDRSYLIPRDNSEKSKAATNEVLNELQLFKDRRMYVPKVNPYGGKPNTKPASSSSTTTKVSSTKSGKKKNDPLGLF